MLIVSSGDISDVDGFFAIAEYAKTGADLLFVMNYPAYLGDGRVAGVCEYGLGYVYSAEKVFNRDRSVKNQHYQNLVGRYSGGNILKRAMTDLAFRIVVRVWEDMGAVGKVYFYIGGVNDVNPFSLDRVKNDVLVFSVAAADDMVRLDPTEGNVYNHHGVLLKPDIGLYDEIFVDFNGSMAFFKTQSWLETDLRVATEHGKIKGAFIMGGVLAEESPRTSPAIEGVLNRFSSATMNQLYSPLGTARFFQFLSDHGIDAFVVTNNAVVEVATAKEKQDKDFHGLREFFTGNGLRGQFLYEIALEYYGGGSPQKPFDYYTAIGISMAKIGYFHREHPKKMFFNVKYGCCLVSSALTSGAAVEAYTSKLDTAVSEGDSSFVKEKKKNFETEKVKMTDMQWEAFPVYDLAFETHADKRIVFTETESMIWLSIQKLLNIARCISELHDGSQ